MAMRLPLSSLQHNLGKKADQQTVTIAIYPNCAHKVIMNEADEMEKSLDISIMKIADHNIT